MKPDDIIVDLIDQFQKMGSEYLNPSSSSQFTTTQTPLNTLFSNANNSSVIPYKRHNYDDSIYILCELPGISKSECKLKYNDYKLYINATKTNTDKWSFVKDKVMQNEIYVGEINKNNISAEMENGILKIILKKYLNEESNIEIN